MAKITWGLLAPDRIETTRRTRTLGLGSAVRSFNEMAVPGLGGVWFGKQLVLATLGVVLAEQARLDGKRIQNIAMANAVEALSCCLALKKNGNGRDPRLRGSTKLHGKVDLSFSTVRKPGFYVTQPMRMATVQTLPALDLAHSDAARFNAFTSTVRGEALIEAAVGKKVVRTLTRWIGGESRISSTEVQSALSPLEPLPDAANEIILAQLNQGNPHDDPSNRARRRAALVWVDSLRTSAVSQQGLDAKPSALDDAHWLDLKVGALFFLTREAAISVLDSVEAHMGRPPAQPLLLAEPVPQNVVTQIGKLRAQAAAYLAFGHPHEEAKVFCNECLDDNNVRVLSKLVERDGRVLRLRDGLIVPGPAFRGSANAALDAEVEAAAEIALTASSKTIAWPIGISHRMRNLFLLNADLHGEISEWMDTVLAPDGDEV